MQLLVQQKGKAPIFGMYGLVVDLSDKFGQMTCQIHSANILAPGLIALVLLDL